MHHQRFSSVGQSSHAVKGRHDHGRRTASITTLGQIKEGAIYHCGFFNFCLKFYHDHVPAMTFPTLQTKKKCNHLWPTGIDTWYTVPETVMGTSLTDWIRQWTRDNGVNFLRSQEFYKGSTTIAAACIHFVLREFVDWEMPDLGRRLDFS
jgi:hypothetical protein